MPEFVFHPSVDGASSTESVIALDEEHARRLLARRGIDGAPPLQVATGTSADGVTVVRRGADLLELVREYRRRGQRTGLAPTMGALHAGHLSLIEASRSECDATIATIFVNPTQFGPNEDFNKYPRTLERDLQLLAEGGADICFTPDVAEMYPEGATAMVAPPEVSRHWEGECRPGHFEGVATIVLKLFQLAPVDRAYFGRKDFQQALVIQRMVEDLKIPIEIRTCPIVREPDGLALSSRNRYLSTDERATALALSHALRSAAATIEQGERDPGAVRKEMHRVLLEGGVSQLDYAEIVGASDLAPLSRIDRRAVAIIAAFVGSTRLIDNREIDPD